MAKTKERLMKDDVGEFPDTAMALTKQPPQDLAAPQVSEAAAAFAEENTAPRKVPDKIPIITIDHKNGGFVLPSGETVPSIAGYPVFYYQTRKFYAKAPRPGEKGNPPDCWSPDQVKPSPSSSSKQSEDCASCKNAAFGSGRDGRGQACATMTWLFLLNPEFGSLPIAALIAPPSSIRTLLGTTFKGGYLAQAAAKHSFYEIVWTELGLKVEGEGGGVEFCSLVPVMGPPATPDNARKIAGFRNRFLAVMEKLRGESPAPEAHPDGDAKED